MITVRLQQGELDEVVASEGTLSVHLERLSEREWWLGITQGQQDIRVVIYAKRATVYGFWENDGEVDCEVERA